MTFYNPTARRQVLGEELRVLRKAAGFNLVQASQVISCSASKLSRVETGHRNAPIDEIASLLGLYRADNTQRTRLLALAWETDDIGWLQGHRPDRGLHQHALTTLEFKADRIIHFAPLVVPELLQTGEYTRTLRAGSGPTSQNDIDDGKVTRLPCRSVFKHRKPPHRVAIIDESVLHRPLAGRDVLRRQLEHLLDAATKRHWTIRVVPSDQAIATGTFTLLRMPDRSPVVHVEHLTCSLFLEQPQDIDAYEQVLQCLNQNALDETGSRELIGHAAKRQSWSFMPSCEATNPSLS